jgi:predicted DNA-binding transcriptional regulator AlpA
MQPVTLYKIPRHLPPLLVLWEDIGRPHPATLAAALDVDTRTVRRWLKAGHAPRPVALALYWLTRWGQSEIDAHLTDRARLLASMVDCLNRELSTLRNRLQALETQTAHAHAQAAPIRSPRTPRRLASRPPLLARPAPGLFTCGV